MQMVDIYILNYNGGRFVDEAIDSLLAQTCTDKHVILSDNNSPQGDAHRLRAKGYEARGLKILSRNPGTKDAWSHYNACLTESQSDFVAIFHHDDLYTPQMVQKQIAFLEANPQIDVVFTAGVAMDVNGKELWPIRISKELDHPILNGRQVFEHTLKHGTSFFITPSALFRKGVIDRFGPMRSDFPIAGDLEFWLRILLMGGKVGYLNEPLIRYRQSAGQGSAVYEKGRITLSEFFVMMDDKIAQWQTNLSISDEVLKAYNALRELDLFQAGLNQLARNGDSKLFLCQLKTLRSPEYKRWIKNFGSIDRLKLLGAAWIAPFSSQSFASTLAKILIQQTDPRISPLLRMALKLKRAVPF